MRSPRSWSLALGAAALGTLGTFAYVRANHTRVPPAEAAPGSPIHLLFAQPFRLERGYVHEWRAERPTVDAGWILVIEGARSEVEATDGMQAVLFAGAQTAERVNSAEGSQRLVVLVPAEAQGAGPAPIPGLHELPLWFGVEELPERFPREHAYYNMQCSFGGKFWARMPQGESRFDVAKRIHQAFGTFHRDAEFHGIHDIVVICHGVTLRAFVMMWCHLSPEWFESEKNPCNCAVRVIDSGVDRGYLFDGYPKR